MAGDFPFVHHHKLSATSGSSPQVVNAVDGSSHWLWLSVYVSLIFQNQQKSIAIFALLCCFAALAALIFSSVNVWGDDEDGITEENCSSDCR